VEDIVKEIKRNKIGKYTQNVNMATYTSYRIGGSVALFVYPEDVLKLIDLIKILKGRGIKYKVLGNASNVIFSDKEYDGVIIKLDKFNYLKRNDTVITVGAGYNLMKLAFEMSRLGLSGLEFATGIPGTIGGAIFMNAGAYKSDMGYIVSSIRVLTPDLEVKEMFNRDLDFHYRTSFLLKNPEYICLDATIVLKHGDKKEIMNTIESRKQKRLLSQPLEYPSAGSVFRNPPDDFAGRLIEESGLKGHQKGGALVSPKHANFIVNTGNATANDVKELIFEVQEKVKEAHGVDLLIEQEFVNWE
jgi:UDP-N-acetylmuramate dehydrogenase